MTEDNRGKWALLIGVNQYPNLPIERQLKGCVNDVELMRKVLVENFGFPPANITLLRDSEATREGILAAMDAVANKVGENDIIVIQYSGHGSQITDREGDEPDGLDETIVPYDSGRGTNPNRDITDDEIYLWLLRLTKVTPFVTLIFDCCHSGTVSRDDFGENARWVEPDERPIAELPSSPIDQQALAGGARNVGPSGWLPLGQRYVLLAGCRDEESSYEHNVGLVDVVRHGALTYFLCQELVKVGAGTTYRDVFERISPQVSAAHSRQHPQLEGARDRELFGIHNIQPTRYVSVMRRSQNHVTVAAGAAHGLTVGSRWAIYPQGTQRITGEIARLGLVEINEVRAVTSSAAILEEREPDAIQVNCRAVEHAHHYGEMRLVVELQVPAGYEAAVNELRSLIEDSALLRLSQPEEAADARIYLIPARSTVQPNDAVPQLGSLDKTVWAVVGRDGRLMMPARAAESGSVKAIRENLEKEVRYRQSLALVNPNRENVLNGKIGFVLKKQTADGGWVDAAADESGVVVYEDRDRLAVEIFNNFSSPVYISIIDFGLTGAISLLHPIAGASERLGQGKTIQIGVRQGDEIELIMPDDFPYLPDPNDAEAGGIETLKLFATTQEVDLSWLLQESFRDASSGEGASAPLSQLLTMALTGRGTRDARRNQIDQDEEWTTAERMFYLRPKTL